MSAPVVPAGLHPALRGTPRGVPSWLALALALAACVAEPAAPGAPPPARAAAPLVTPPPAAPVVDGDWRARVRAHVDELAARAPALHAELIALAPVRTRPGLPRFTQPALHDPRAAAVLLARLARGGDPDEVRAALVEALPRTGGLYADAVRDLVATEPAAVVRAAYVHSVRRAPAGDALPVIARGLADVDPGVTAEAARAAAAHADGGQLAPALEAALGSGDPGTRAEAARALGVLRVPAASPALAARLSDADAEVRLAALRALDRVTPGAPAVVAAARALAADADPRVAALAARITTAAAHP